MIGNGIPKDVILERDQDAIPCPCGGYCDKVDCIVEECEKYGCGCDEPGSECCAVAFVCRRCKTRFAGSYPAPDIEII